MSNDEAKLETKQSEPAIKAVTTKRARKTKVMLEHELSEIYRLLVDGVSPQEIKATRNISDRNYTKYMQKLKKWAVGEQQTERREYFVLHKEIARERFLADKRYLLEIIKNPKTSERVRMHAIKSDIDLNIVLLKLETEGAMFFDELTQERQVLGTSRK